MILLPTAKRLSVFLLIFVLAMACKQPETIIVDRDPETATAGDTTDQSQTGRQAASFQQLNIGELEPIRSLDPLLATNSAETRAIQLLYEGLVRFDETGTITPAIAREWSSSNDRRQYTFHLRSDVFFHNSEVFGSGTGRKLTANDVRFVFERMAHNDVPPHAAELFMNIEGFDAYFREQRLLYKPSLRTLDKINGIRTPDDTTVVFELNEPDPDFLQKLASPLAVVYPREATRRNTDSFAAVGSGPFTLSQQSSDSSFIFSKFNNYYGASDVQLNRVDVISSSNESALFQALEEGDIHFLPALGPSLARRVLSADMSLAMPYANRYALEEAGEIQYTLRRHLSSSLSQGQAAALAQLAQNNGETLFDPFGPLLADTSYMKTEADVPPTGSLNTEAPATEDPYATAFLLQLSELLANQGGMLAINDVRIPTQQTGVFMSRYSELLPTVDWSRHPEVASFTIQQYSLKRQNIQHLAANRYSWWINLRKTELPAD
ncbi:ABC transporter substrate-binding protein [Fodinibius sediminis]|uniref:Extracellular solute-binding protein, family 5 Middle n=1 Tax=Fodinibius sediminis TaxID=1214077 RepID=A0A521DI36_9BACT|nr:ABC transporter substrate-binding protein [Fodinibius sediminis]SMO70580.1 extracellular solute-binding protein, family 5 Middle [Fodinibius sediminis]